MLTVTLALFLCYAVFWQSFDDLWECFFLLAALRVFMAKAFKTNALLWVLCGLLGACAYFAKAYAFPFFILNAIVVTYVISPGDRKLQLKMALATIVSMLAFSMPWIWMLHGKYGLWTTSTAGPLNTSWYLVGHPNWKQGIDLLIPPTYPDSPYYWEDPYFANGDTPHFWNSLSLFGLQFVRLGLNILKLLVSMLQISLLLPVVFYLFFNFMLLLVKHGKALLQDLPNDSFILGASFILFPAGYLLVNFESRYIWYMLPLGMTLGAINVSHIRHDLRRYVLAFVFPLTFILYPVHCMKLMYHEGENEYAVAEQLKQLKIHGTFTAIASPGLEAQRIRRLAYFSGNPYYSTTKKEVQPAAMLQEMRRYHVNYFFAYGERAKTDRFTDESGNPFPEITQGKIDGLKVYQVNP
jgi:hypothetical protein